MSDNNIEKKEKRGRKKVFTEEEAYARKKAYILKHKAEQRDEFKTKYLKELYSTIRKSKNFDSVKELLFKLRIPH